MWLVGGSEGKECCDRSHIIHARGHEHRKVSIAPLYAQSPPVPASRHQALIANPREGEQKGSNNASFQWSKHWQVSVNLFHKQYSCIWVRKLH